MHEEELLNGWIPYRIMKNPDGTINFRWMFMGDHSFTEPFFEESIAACLSNPENIPGRFPVTSVQTLLKVAAMKDNKGPDGIVYHISRCGSTLVSQLLACDERNIVLSEVPLLDEILRSDCNTWEANGTSRELLFKAVLRLLGNPKSGRETKLFVKTDSWHILFYDELRKWFPHAITFLMYRHPEEVGLSQLRAPAMHSVPGVLAPALFQLNETTALQMTREAYLDHVLECYLQTYLRVLGSGESAIALNYDSGPLHLIQSIYSACGIDADDAVYGLMKQRALFHSKNPDKSFHGDAPGQTDGSFSKSLYAFGKLQQMVTNKAQHEA